VHWLQLGEVDSFVDELIASKSERIAEALPGSSFARRRKELTERLERWLQQRS